MHDFISLKENQTSAQSNRNDFNTIYTSNLSCVTWPPNLLVTLFFNLSPNKGNNSCYVSYRKEIKLTELRIMQTDCIPQKNCKFSVVTDPWLSLQVHNTPSETELEGLNYFNIHTTNISEHLLCVRYHTRTLGILWPTRWTRRLLFTIHLREILIKLVGLPISLCTKGSNPFDF